jgi:hypothetical protein
MTTGTKASREAGTFDLGLKHKYLYFRRTKIVATTGQQAPRRP